jgi:Cu/Zn superoxide dismutase
VTLTGPDANGTAELTVNGEGILVTLSMTGLQEGVHANHIHEGTCDDQGAIHITLDNIVAGAAGDGSQINNNTEQPLSHYEFGHYLAVHEADGSPGAVVSCGNIVVP